MEPLPREASAVDLRRPRSVPGRTSLPTVHYVAVVFKERRYHDGKHKIWFFTNIHQVDVVQGRLHLTREGHGLVFDIPYEEVEKVYIDHQRTFESMPEAEVEE